VPQTRRLGGTNRAVGHCLSVFALCAGLAWPGAAPASTEILAVGDFGVGGVPEREIGAAMRRFEADHPADLILTLGDNDYTESPEAFRQNWRDAFGWRRDAGLGVAGTLGNHDIIVDNGRYEFGPLNMPRARYRRTVGSVDLFVLNSNRVSHRQTAWLANALGSSTARWKIAVAHHPAWTCGGYRSHPGVLQRWVPLFEEHGVDLVLSGHDHNYQRFAARNGVRYLVHGGGNTNLYPIEDCPAGYPQRRFARAVRGFLFLRATDTELRVSSVTLRGRVIDRVAIGR
jgi:3',5'-cyclic AMP phosphodiesterase CpdA